MEGYVILKCIDPDMHHDYVAFKHIENNKACFTHNLDFARRFISQDDALYFRNFYAYECKSLGVHITGLTDTVIVTLEEAWELMQHNKKIDTNTQYVICHNTSRYGIEFYRGENPLGIYTRDLYKAIRYKYSKDAFELINNIEHNKDAYFVAEFENIKVYLQNPTRNILPHVPDLSKRCRDEEIMLGFNPTDPWLEKNPLLYRSQILGEPYENAVAYVKKDVETTKEVLEAMFNYEQCSTRVTPRRVPDIEKVIFNDPATIVYWKDGTKTIVQCRDGEIFDPEKGLAIAMAKKALGNKHDYYEEFKKHVGRYEKQQRKNAEKKAATKKDGNKKCNKKQNKQ